MDFIKILTFFLGTISLVNLIAYFGTYLILYLFKDVNLKKQYNCEYAVVTGGTSGIGKEVVEMCASQGYNCFNNKNKW
jgi:hypothetical protein